MLALIELRALRRLSICAICFAALMTLQGQDVNSRSRSSNQETRAEEIVPSAGSYTLRWRRHYQRQMGLMLTGTSDDNGVLWLITHAGPGKPDNFLTKISATGELIGNYKPAVPLNPHEWVSYLAPAASGRSAGLLASLASGGRDQIFEGAFFLPIGSDGLDAPAHIAGRGPQFPVMIGAGAGNFIAAGDQEPLTLIKLDSNGKTLWRRAFSRKLALPAVSVGNSGYIFVISQGGAYVLLQMLDPSGRILRSKRIAAKQGAVVAEPRRRLQVTPSAAKIDAKLELFMKKPIPVESASALIDEKIKELGDWRGKTLAKVREILHEADPEIVEEWKWRGTPVWSHGGIVCTGETYKNAVKMTFAKGAALKDPSGLFNSSLDGNVRRAIDIHEGGKLDESALKDLIRAAVALNLMGKSKPKPRRAGSKRTG